MLPLCSTRKLNTPSIMQEVKIQFWAQQHAAAPVGFSAVKTEVSGPCFPIQAPTLSMSKHCGGGGGGGASPEM